VRLLVLCDEARSGEQNMAIDRAMLRASEQGAIDAVLLRIYSWDPPAVSLGYHQSSDAIDTEALRRRGIGLVRRPTGGAAVLHAEEWTYSIAGPRKLEGLGDGFAEIYPSIAKALVAALRSLDVPAESGGQGGPDSFACFAALEGHEISVAGRKLVGSAFRQGRRAFLQHGSLLRGEAHLDLVEYLAGADPKTKELQRELLRRRTTHLTELGRGDLGAREFASALATALAHRLRARPEWLSALPEELGIPS